MNSLRRWLYRPKRSDSSLLAQFYFADEELNQVAAELDSFEGRKDPERCTALVNQLRACQARVLNVVSQMMDETVKGLRAPRDFRVKFPDDVIQENLAGQLWFGAECLAAGSSIMNREAESASMRPLARALTKNLDSLRSILRDQCLRNVNEYTEAIRESLIIFDKLFAEFELRYVSAMVPVKTAHEYDMIQEITVLFSETVQRALKIGLLTKDTIDEYDPALMFTIPRLAIVSGVLIFKDGPLNPDNDPWNISDMFRPFQTLLLKIRDLLSILSEEELNTLERALCSQEEPSYLLSLEEKKRQNSREERRKIREEKKAKGVTTTKEMIKDGSDDGSVESELTALEIAERLEALALNFEASRNTKQSQSNEQPDPEAHCKVSASSSTSSSSSSSSSSPSLLSEADSEEIGTAEVVRESGSGSDDSEDVQLQRFTNQLYYEANMDSYDIAEDVSLMGPLNAFTPPEIFTNPPEVNNSVGAKNDEGGIAYSDADVTNTQEDDVENAALKMAAAGRFHFAMNKCDSSDSGLHSEVLSNSGSMFTISSSDSNQHLGNSETLVAPECGHSLINQTSCSVSCVQHHECDNICLSEASSGDLHIDSRDSSSTLLPESNCDDKLCLKPYSSKCETSGANSISGNASNEDDIMVSPLEETKTVGDSVPNITLKGETEPEVCAVVLDKINCEQEVEKIVSDSLNDLERNNDINSQRLVNGEQDTNVFHIFCNGVGETEEHIDCELNGMCPAAVEVLSSACSTNLHDGIRDNIVPMQNIDTSKEEKILVKAEEAISQEHDSFHISHSLSLPMHPTMPSLASGEDRENNNDVKDGADGAIYTCQHSTENVDQTVHDSKETLIGTNGASEEVSPNLASSQHAQAVTSPSSNAPVMCCASTTTEYSGPQGLSKHSSIIASSPSKLPVTSSQYCASSTSEQSESQEVRQLMTTTHIHIESHSPTTSTSGASTTARLNHRGAKGSSKSKISSKKNSRSGTSDSKRRQQNDTRSSMPGQAKALMDSHLLDTECYHSSETSSYTSDCADQEEIALAIKAAENATRHQVRARFRSSSDMIHRLFVCISGVADQLQTNFAGDLRNILRAVFDMNCSEPMDISEGDKCKDTTPLGAAYQAMSQASRNARRLRNSSNQRQDPPTWVPDDQSNECMSCQVPFTFVRRRHHCRNCGKIYCSRCSSNFVPLPHFGQEKAVRVCNRCFMFQVTPFTVRPSQ